MKVRESQIPEDNGKPQRIAKDANGGWRRINPDEVDDEVEKYFDNIGEGEETEEKVYWKTMFNFSEIGLTLSVNHIQSIEKTFEYRVSDYTDKEQLRYGIAINRGIPPTPSCPKTDINIWYNREETRDHRYTELMKALEEARVKVIEIK